MMYCVYCVIGVSGASYGTTIKSTTTKATVLLRVLRSSILILQYVFYPTSPPYHYYDHLAYPFLLYIINHFIHCLLSSRCLILMLLLIMIMVVVVVVFLVFDYVFVDFDYSYNDNYY